MQVLVAVVLFGCSGEANQPLCQGNENTSSQSMREELLDIMNIQVPVEKKSDFVTEYTEEKDDYTLSRITISTEGMEDIPGYVLTPTSGKPPFPVMVCLQGHSPGMYISLGQAKSERDLESIKGGRDLAIQAVENGWAAVVIEQKGFGERAEEGVSCNDLSLRELMKGNPILGQRVSDVSRAIDYIETRDDLDHNMIGCIGNSSGGTTSYFAAAVEERINLAVVSCSFATYESSWLKYPHCSCGYLPGVLEVGDMPDFARLIAPRNLLIVAGVNDHIADIEGVRDGYLSAKEAYREKGKLENVVLLEGDGGHQFYPDLAWPQINKMK